MNLSSDYADGVETVTRQDLDDAVSRVECAFWEPVGRGEYLITAPTPEGVLTFESVWAFEAWTVGM